MALILNIETSTDICSVCISDNDNILNYKEIKDEKSHASKLGLFIEELFKDLGIQAKKLDAVAVSRGPGSYTGLRIGVSTAKGIAYAIEKPLISIDSFKALSRKVIKELEKQNENLSKTLFCPMIDAKRMEVYTSLFDNNLENIEKISAKNIDTDSFQKYLETRKIYFFGNGAEKCKPILNSRNAFFIDNINPSSLNMVIDSYERYMTRKFEDIAYFEPYYLKDFVATISKKKIF